MGVRNCQRIPGSSPQASQPSGSSPAPRAARAGSTDGHDSRAHGRLVAGSGDGVAESHGVLPCCVSDQASATNGPRAPRRLGRSWWPAVQRPEVPRRARQSRTARLGRLLHRRGLDPPPRAGRCPGSGGRRPGVAAVAADPDRDRARAHPATDARRDHRRPDRVRDVRDPRRRLVRRRVRPGDRARGLRRRGQRSGHAVPDPARDAQPGRQRHARHQLRGRGDRHRAGRRVVDRRHVRRRDPAHDLERRQPARRVAARIGHQLRSRLELAGHAAVRRVRGPGRLRQRGLPARRARPDARHEPDGLGQRRAARSST